MVRPLSFLLSFWLAALFVVGQGAHVPQIVVWPLGLAAILAGLGGTIAPMVSPAWRIAGPVALSLGLFALWLVALLMHSAPWLPWCIFMGTAIFISVVIGELIWSPRNRGTMAPADS